MCHSITLSNLQPQFKFDTSFYETSILVTCGDLLLAILNYAYYTICLVYLLVFSGMVITEHQWTMNCACMLYSGRFSLNPSRRKFHGFYFLDTCWSDLTQDQKSDWVHSLIHRPHLLCEEKGLTSELGHNPRALLRNFHVHVPIRSIAALS